MSAVERRWQRVAKLALQNAKDPWSDFDVAETPVQHVLRHKYRTRINDTPESKNEESHIQGEWVTDESIVKIENQPFASGAMRSCFRLKKLPQAPNQNALKALDWKNAHNYVAKRYKKETERHQYFDDVRLQAEAAFWAEMYNNHEVKPPKPIDMILCYVIEFVNSEEKELYCVERFIEGDYLKHNSNSGYVEDEYVRLTPQSFSHFTWQKSKAIVMVVDVQGVDDLYTDPQIHSHNTSFGDGDLGHRGMAMFFQTHRCNPLCGYLHLEPFNLSPLELNHLIHCEWDSATSVELRRTGSPDARSPDIRESNLEDFMNEFKEIQNSLDQCEEPKNECGFAATHMAMTDLHMTARFSENRKVNNLNALYHLHLAAIFGSTTALIALANAYQGNCFDDKLPEDADQYIEQNAFLSTKLWKWAAELGSLQALFNVGRAYHIGEGNEMMLLGFSETNFCKALECYEKVISSGAQSEDVEVYKVMMWAADIYASGGDGVEQDIDTARDYYFEAGSQAMTVMDMYTSNQCFEIGGRL